MKDSGWVVDRYRVTETTVAILLRESWKGSRVLVARRSKSIAGHDVSKVQHTGPTRSFASHQQLMNSTTSFTPPPANSQLCVRTIDESVLALLK